MHVFLGFARCPFLVILKTLRFVALLGLMIPTPTPTIFRKRRFSKIHVFLVVLQEGILGDPEKPYVL